ncbi:MAG: serine/threonine protein kinase, bacterial, partial [Mycobacterium sp.]|nr:serine/threonine protein kinase, bacterial [Mycobacterium sp.]
DWPRQRPDRFAGIEIDEFDWARQRARRATLLWVIAVLTLTGLVAVGAWTLGSNLDGLL